MAASTGGAAPAGPVSETEARHAHESPRRGRTRERLLDAAYDVFAELGVHAATVEQITERAGFTRGAFYSNFTTKEELFFALMERENGLRLAALREQVEVLQPRIAAALSPVDEVTLGEVILDLLVGPFDDRKWCLVQSEFRLLAMRDRTVAPQLLAHQGRFGESLTPIVLGAVANAGREFVVDVRLALGLLAGIYEDGVEASLLAGGHVRDIAQVRTDLARTVLVLTRPDRLRPAP
jgi:AcrR family transcriptional regulator